MHSQKNLPRRTLAQDLFGKPDRAKTINQKLKGNANELVCCKFLCKWCKVPFVRVPNSGGLRWRTSSRIVGDAICDDANFNFPFVAETKHLKKVHITEALRINSKVYTLWKQVSYDSDRSGKIPMLLLRGNGTPVGEYQVFFGAKVSGILIREFKTEFLCRGITNSTEMIYGFNSTDLLKINFRKLVAHL